MNIFNPTTMVGIHSLLSVIALLAGIPVVLDLLRGQGQSRLTMLFLVTAVATDVTGFFLPAPGFLPSHGVGIISLVALVAAFAAAYGFERIGAWRWIYVGSIVAAEYFLFFVGIAQAFLKVPLLADAVIASQAPFAVSHLAALAIFIALGVLAIRARPAPLAV